jgi:type II secretory pathway predicted ATPase ExeA
MRVEETLLRFGVQCLGRHANSLALQAFRKRQTSQSISCDNFLQSLAPIIDDAHLIHVEDLRRLRLLFEDFPKNHNLVLVAQPGLISSLALTPNHDLQSRVTYSVLVPRLAADDIERFVYRELDAVALPHTAFSPDAFGLIVRSSEGYLRRARNLCVGALLEAVRDRVRTVELKQVNRVLLQPHWRDRETS